MTATTDTPDEDPLLVSLLHVLQGISTSAGNVSLPPLEEFARSSTTLAIYSALEALASRLSERPLSHPSHGVTAPSDSSTPVASPSASFALVPPSLLSPSSSSSAYDSTARGSRSARGDGNDASAVHGPCSTAGLSAAEELRLLRAQVKDVARVCKVRRASLLSFDAW